MENLRVKYRAKREFLEGQEVYQEGLFHQWAKDGTIALIENNETHQIDWVSTMESEIIFIPLFLTPKGLL